MKRCKRSGLNSHIFLVPMWSCEPPPRHHDHIICPKPELCNSTGLLRQIFPYVTSFCFSLFLLERQQLSLYFCSPEFLLQRREEKRKRGKKFLSFSDIRLIKSLHQLRFSCKIIKHKPDTTFSKSRFNIFGHFSVSGLRFWTFPWTWNQI